MKTIKCIIFGFFLLFIGGCQTIDSSGNLITDQDLVAINEQHPTKAELIAMIGSPTYVPNHSPNTWYYIERVYSKRSVLSRKLTKQQVMKATFRENNLLKAELVDNIQANDNIKINPESTEAYGCDAGAIQKFVDNVGRFRKPASKNKKKGAK